MSMMGPLMFMVNSKGRAIWKPTMENTMEIFQMVESMEREHLFSRRALNMKESISGMWSKEKASL